MSTRRPSRSPGGTPRRSGSATRPGAPRRRSGSTAAGVDPSGQVTTRRTGIPQVWRLAGVALIVVLLGVFLFPTVSGYLEQRREVSRLEQQIQTQREDIETLERDLARWDNPDYIEQRARQRLRFVRDGETAFTVLDDTGELLTEPVPGMAPVSNDVHELRPWYGEVWESVKIAGEEPAQTDADQ
ncbi:MAG: FtsB family cell division protein [Ornithinimicrobium sp.]|uniref:FtsB family cell division protein n=1 Tax=Ornithinimicrobium sp. TaxID=1977084 RepID=UPI003D9BFB56